MRVWDLPGLAFGKGVLKEVATFLVIVGLVLPLDEIRLGEALAAFGRIFEMGYFRWLVAQF